MVFKMEVCRICKNKGMIDEPGRKGRFVHKEIDAVQELLNSQFAKRKTQKTGDGEKENPERE